MNGFQKSIATLLVATLFYAPASAMEKAHDQETFWNNTTTRSLHQLADDMFPNARNLNEIRGVIQGAINRHRVAYYVLVDTSLNPLEVEATIEESR